MPLLIDLCAYSARVAVADTHTFSSDGTGDQAGEERKTLHGASFSHAFSWRKPRRTYRLP